MKKNQNLKFYNLFQMFRCSDQSGAKKIILAKSSLHEVRFNPGKKVRFTSHKWFITHWYFKIQGDEANCHKKPPKLTLLMIGIFCRAPFHINHSLWYYYLNLNLGRTAYKLTDLTWRGNSWTNPLQIGWFSLSLRRRHLSSNQFLFVFLLPRFCHL